MAFESLQPLGYGVASIGFIIATVSIGRRVYSRAYIVRSFALDDWVMASIFVRRDLFHCPTC